MAAKCTVSPACIDFAQRTLRLYWGLRGRIDVGPRSLAVNHSRESTAELFSSNKFTSSQQPSFSPFMILSNFKMQTWRQREQGSLQAGRFTHHLESRTTLCFSCAFVVFGPPNTMPSPFGVFLLHHCMPPGNYQCRSPALP